MKVHDKKLGGGGEIETSKFDNFCKLCFISFPGEALAGGNMQTQLATTRSSSSCEKTMMLYSNA